MNFTRLSLLATTLSLCHCTVPAVPEPPEFSLSPAAIRKKYPATRTTGTTELFAREIVTTTDEEGHKTHLASGGSLLFQKTDPPIWAQAPGILLTPDFVEVPGKAVVKKNDRLFLGEDESSKFIIEGTIIKPEGPHAIRAIAHATESPAESSPPDDVTADAESAPQKEKPKPKAKARAAAVKPRPAQKAEPLPSADRAKLLQLMREPKEP